MIIAEQKAFTMTPASSKESLRPLGSPAEISRTSSRAQKSQERHPGEGGQARQEAQNGSHRGAAGDAQDIGIGQGIAQQGLENQATQGEAGPHQYGQEGPGPANPPDNGGENVPGAALA